MTINDLEEKKASIQHIRAIEKELEVLKEKNNDAQSREKNIIDFFTMTTVAICFITIVVFSVIVTNTDKKDTVRDNIRPQVYDMIHERHLNQGFTEIKLKDKP